MELKLQIGIKNIVKALFISAIFLGVHSNIVLGQEAEEKTEKTEKKGKKEKKEKESKDSGKMEKTDKKAASGKYRRSSLHTMIIEDAKLPKIDIILKTFNNAEFPDKYNNHTIGAKSFDISKYGKQIDTTNVTEEKKEKADKDMSPAINKYFAENKVANQLMAKWFNRNEDGAFNMNLIGDRGSYDASAQDAAAAASTERGTSMLADAGEELIPNTFVVVNYSKFVSNEVAAKISYDIAVMSAQKLPAMAQKPALALAEKLYEKARQGYSVWTTAYLYQLEWNDSVQAVFYQDMWMDTNSIDPARKELFDNTNLFQLKLLGYQKASALISGLGANADGEEMIIKNATIKSINAVYAKLQRKFEPFRTKTPLVSVDPLGAKIGLKEGLEGGDKYEVLQQEFDAEGKVTYKRKGVIKVDKSKIWNNMFNAGEGNEVLDENGEPIKTEDGLEFTHFKGGKGFYPGMLIRQIN
jgi:hypothetical protein